MLKSILIPLIVIALIEGAFRMTAFINSKHPHDFQAGKKLENISEVMTPTLHPKEGFRLLSNINVTFKGKRLTSNNLGFRDREFKKEKPDSIFRIIGIGDSVMMGWGVHDGETYLDHLENELRECQGKKIEVQNWAIAGQSAQQELFVLQHALTFKPDALIIGYVGNDWINEAQEREFPHFNSPSYALNFIINIVIKGKAHFQKVPTFPFKEAKNLPDAYTKMANLTQKMNRLVLMDSRYQSEMANHQQTEQLFKRLGFNTINLLEEWNPEAKNYIGGEAVKRETEHNRLYLIPNDWHPNAIWHFQVAKRVARYFRNKVCI